MATRIVALLGRRETPTDGVEDYCTFLAEALSCHGVEMYTERVDWADLGWFSALQKLRRQATDWHGTWIVVHYTALSWSRRGFPFGILLVLSILRRRRLRCTVLFHESGPQGSRPRLINKIRGAVQGWVADRCFRTTDRAIFTIPPETVPWLPRESSKAVYVPIGANIPERLLPSSVDQPDRRTSKTVAVFCLSHSENRSNEIADLAHAAERVRDLNGPIRFVVLGKGSAEARTDLERAFNGNGMELSVLGRLPAHQIADTLAAADVLLYVYGLVTQNRSSALAGLACGLPVVGYGSGTYQPIHDAGVLLVPYRNRQALADALVRVLRDDTLRAELRRRSCTAQLRDFSWGIIARKYVAALELGENMASATGGKPSRPDELMREQPR